MKLFHRQAPAVPLTSINLLLPHAGACGDPQTRQGLTRLVSRLVFMGAGGLDNTQFNSRMERLGASAGAQLTNDHLAFRLFTLTRNLDEALELFLTAINQPAFHSHDFERMQGEMLSGWVSDREENKRIKAQETYLHNVYNHTPHGYQPDGTEAGLKAITLSDITARYAELFSSAASAAPMLAVLSDLPRDAVESRVLSRFTLPQGTNGKSWAWDNFAPPPANGRRVTVIPEKDTHTDEVILGAFSTHQKDPNWHLHRLISLIFGGDMNSRLFRVVRGEKGLSYGASCWYESSQGRVPHDRSAPFSMYTFPSGEHTAEAVPLMLSMYEELVQKGVTEEELQRARQYLINAHPFMRDTPQKVLGLEIDQALYGIEVPDEDENRRLLEAVTPDDVQAALRDNHHPDQLNIVLLGDPDRLLPIAEGIPNAGGVTLLDAEQG